MHANSRSSSPSPPIGSTKTQPPESFLRTCSGAIVAFACPRLRPGRPSRPVADAHGVPTGGRPDGAHPTARYDERSALRCVLARVRAGPFAHLLTSDGREFLSNGNRTSSSARRALRGTIADARSGASVVAGALADRKGALDRAAERRSLAARTPPRGRAAHPIDVPRSRRCDRISCTTFASTGTARPRNRQAGAARRARARGQRVNTALLDLRAPRYEESEPIFLTAAEVDALASWSSEPLLIRFAALTGLRLGELLALRDTEIDLDDGYVLVVRAARKGVEGRTKTGKKRRVYFCAAAMQALREQLLARRPTPTGLIFPSPRSDRVWNSDNFRADVFAKAVKRAAQQAQPGRGEDLARLQFHDLRHTFASLMIAAGANPLQIAEALGHSDNAGRPDPTLVWKRYGHLYPGSTREAMAALDRYLRALSR